MIILLIEITGLDSIRLIGINRAGSGQNPTRNLARGPWLLSGATRPGPHLLNQVCYMVVLFIIHIEKMLCLEIGL